MSQRSKLISLLRSPDTIYDTNRSERKTVFNSQLNDAEIRPFFLIWLYKRNIQPKYVFNEINIADGAARPDIVALYTHAHCFEIKGDNDQVERMIKQSNFYHLSFKKNTLITTYRHYKKALSILPEFWGIIIAEKKPNNDLKFIYKRKAKNSPVFNKAIASKILWKVEMQTLLSKKQISYSSKNNRFDLIDLISENYSTTELNKEICNSLLNRKIS